ncbi:hypothetical protein MVEN_00094300 [Mycena venus]|uniref:Uncharacterized protein n=1 Tax=Mycena venus TaxID=2733690 RepID=A0A8H7DIA2_9AGAR|nr:hypothetical protein MVEN_00094300 [Mycena venus]
MSQRASSCCHNDTLTAFLPFPHPSLSFSAHSSPSRTNAPFIPANIAPGLTLPDANELGTRELLIQRFREGVGISLAHNPDPIIPVPTASSLRHGHP